MTGNKTIIYLTNKELLAEIHKAKNTFCHYDRPEYSRFDVIVRDKAEITEQLLQETMELKIANQSKRGAQPWAGLDENGNASIESVIVRVMTDEHIPLDDGTSKRRRPNGSLAVRTVFPPFKHYKMENGEIIEVGRSHWVGSLSNGYFSPDSGKITNRLGKMFMLLVDRISIRSNWRGYSYVDEMRSYALMQLSQVGLQFDESKSDNPFAFYTQVVKNSFTRTLNVEKKNHNIRDDLLIMAGASPSHTRHVENEMKQHVFAIAPAVMSPVKEEEILPEKPVEKTKKKTTPK